MVAAAAAAAGAGSPQEGAGGASWWCEETHALRTHMPGDQGCFQALLTSPSSRFAAWRERVAVVPMAQLQCIPGRDDELRPGEGPCAAPFAFHLRGAYANKPTVLRRAAERALRGDFAARRAYLRDASLGGQYDGRLYCDKPSGACDVQLDAATGTVACVGGADEHVRKASEKHPDKYC